VLPSLLLHAVVLGVFLLVAHDRPIAPRTQGPVETVEVGFEAAVVTQGSAAPAGPPAPTAPAGPLGSRAIVRARPPMPSASAAAAAASQEPRAEPPRAVQSGSRPPSAGPLRSPRKHLSLEALGITPGAHTTWDLPTGTPPSPAQRREREIRASEQRLARSMQQQTIERDGKIGLGPQGPILRVLSREAAGSLAAAPSYAVVLAKIDGHGVLSLHLVQANRDYEQWAEVARRVQAALASTTLRLPAGTHGLALEIRVDVRDELPSGADPGLGVELLGIPLKRGQGDRSAKLKLLEPKLELTQIEVPSLSGGTVELPQVAIGLAPLGVEADPANLGANAQRMVHVRVTRRTAL
jgi:hypothetical protein